MGPLRERAFWEDLASTDAMSAAWAAEGDGIEACLHYITTLVTEGDWPSGRILELGCGPGRLLAPLARAHPSLDFVGVDISNGMLGEAAAVCPGNVQLLRVDGRTLDGALLQSEGVGSLGLAYSVLVFQHIPDDAVKGYLKEVYDRLLEGGYFFFQYVVGEGDTFMNHHRRKEDVEDWCRSVGFTVTLQLCGYIYPQWNWIMVKK